MRRRDILKWICFCPCLRRDERKDEFFELWHSGKVVHVAVTYLRDMDGPKATVLEVETENDVLSVKEGPGVIQMTSDGMSASYRYITTVSDMSDRKGVLFIIETDSTDMKAKWMNREILFRTEESKNAESR